MIKSVLKKILAHVYANKNKIKLDIRSMVSRDTLKKCGEHCLFYGNVSVSPNVEIGRFTSINGPATRVAAAVNKIKIGSFCSIASGTVIQEYYHKYDRITSYYVNKNIFGGKTEDDIFSKGDIVIEDDVWIGSNVVILSGVTVGRGSIIGAGSVVTKDIPRYSIVAGNPSKVLKSRFKDSTIDYLEGLEWWSWSIEKLRDNRNLFNLEEDELISHHNSLFKS